MPRGTGQSSGTDVCRATAGDGRTGQAEVSNGARASELSQQVSPDELMNLAEEFGGTRLYFPIKLSLQGRLVAAVGVDAAKRLVSMFAGTTVRVPLLREARLLKYRNEGKSIRWCALRLGMTETGVEKLLARMKSRIEDCR